METSQILQNELKGSVDYFLDFTNLKPDSKGYGLTVDSTKDLRISSIAAVGFALTAWVIADARGYISHEKAIEIVKGTLHTLLYNVSHHRGFFAHFVDMESGERLRKCEYSTIDTSLCLNGVITAAAYFDDTVIKTLARQLQDRVDWDFIVFEKDDVTLFRMAYNPDADGDYVNGKPGFLGQWDMAAEQKMMYLQAATRIDPLIARKLYQGFSRDTGYHNGQPIIITPGGNLFVYQFSEAWLDTEKYLDLNGVDWFENTRRAAQANREFCMEHAAEYKTYHARSWGLSAGDSPFGYEVAGSAPSLVAPHHTGTVSIYSALACLPFLPAETLEMVNYLYAEQPQTWGKYGFFDAYNLAVDPPWYSNSLYGIDKGCSMILIENYLSGLVWNTYTNSLDIQKALSVLGFTKRIGMQSKNQ